MEAAPHATVMSGSMWSLRSLPKKALSCSLTSGTLVDPPTSTTSSTSSLPISRSPSSRVTGSRARWKSAAQWPSKSSLLTSNCTRWPRSGSWGRACSSARKGSSTQRKGAEGAAVRAFLMASAWPCRLAGRHRCSSVTRSSSSDDEDDEEEALGGGSTAARTDSAPPEAPRAPAVFASRSKACSCASPSPSSSCPSSCRPDPR
mmetsp:Transcript_13583/g.18611  ORF Transcript_13583/g.18611 Transcript_13583/m.18611 type:complete len:203 (-) Transcript_13583:596-1204(-)